MQADDHMKLVALLAIGLIAIIVFLTVKAIKYKKLYEDLQDAIEIDKTKLNDDEI